MMVKNPKTRKAPTKPSAFAFALDRHKAAKAAWDAKTDRIDDDPVCLGAADALIGLAETPCAGTAEFLEKLKYLLEAESEAHGGYYKLAEYGSIIAAVDTHFGIEEPA